MYGFNADRLHISVRHVFIRVNHIKPRACQAFAVPAKPELVQPAYAQWQRGHLNVPEKCRRLVKPLRHNGDVALAPH